MELYPLILFILQLAMALGISLLVIHLLRPALGQLLEEVCTGQAAAAFWLSFTRLMVLIAPLLQVILLASSDTAASPVALLRSTLLHGLAGVFVALAMIGLVIWHIALTDQANRRNTQAGQ